MKNFESPKNVYNKYLDHNRLKTPEQLIKNYKTGAKNVAKFKSDKNSDKLYNSKSRNDKNPIKDSHRKFAFRSYDYNRNSKSPVEALKSYRKGIDRGLDQVSIFIKLCIYKISNYRQK